MNFAPIELAERNLMLLTRNTYAGRGIFQGRTDPGWLAQGTWITVRSDPNRNRCYERRADGIEVVVADPSQETGDPELTLYPAMLDAIDDDAAVYVIGNGRQTSFVMEHYKLGNPNPLYTALHDVFPAWCKERSYEPDRIATPRITGAIEVRQADLLRAEFSILRKSRTDDGVNRSLHTLEELPAGIAYCVHTYDEDGDPPPTFSQQPYPIRLTGETAEEVLEGIWPAIHETNRVALAVRLINPADDSVEIAIRNVRERVVV